MLPGHMNRTVLPANALTNFPRSICKDPSLFKRRFAFLSIILMGLCIDLAVSDIFLGGKVENVLGGGELFLKTPRQNGPDTLKESLRTPDYR